MKVKLNEQGLLPAIAQDANTGQVLMMGYMNPGSLKRTVEGVQVWFYSRSREDLWHKGEVSGNYLNLKEAWLDCDADTILLKVDPDLPAPDHQIISLLDIPELLNRIAGSKDGAK